MRNRLGIINIASRIAGPCFLALLLAAAILYAVPSTAAADDDPPGRVARLNYIQGSVSFQPAGTQDWIDASPNRPLTTGDNLWADQDSRGELHVGNAVLRLSSQTGISFLNLNDQTTQLQLAQGSLYVRVRQLDEGEAFEIDTPNLAFSILRPGQYRVNVDPNGGSTVIAVWGGSGEVTGGGQAFPLNPGQEFAFSGTDQLTYEAQPLPGRDDFDNWCVSRDQREDRSASARYVSRGVIGYNDLDDYGAWRTDPEYGPVWIPSGVAVGWAPYHYGHWVFVAPWGWTWVEDEPWGFAPFHYGRWAVVGGVWGWVPGPVAVGVVVGGPIVRPMYAPALVGFVGGGGFSMSIAIGGGAGVAWFPLGPRDVWVPAYHCSPVYVQHVNVYNTRVVNVTQVTNVYNNVYVNHNTTVVNNYTYANNVHAVTAVDRDTFVSGRPVARASMQISQEQIQHPRVIDQAPTQPTQRSALGGQATARALPPAALANRRVVTKLTPAPNVVPIGHTQPLARTGGGASNAGLGKPAGQYGNQPGNQPGFQQPRQQPGSNAGNANVSGNAHSSNDNNNPRPGYRPFQPPNSNSNAGNKGVSGNNTGGAATANPNGQPNNNARPVFHPPSQNNGSTNQASNPSFNRNNRPSSGGQPTNAQPTKTQSASVQPKNTPTTNENAHPTNTGNKSFQPPHQQTEAKPPHNPPPNESKPPKKGEEKDHKDEH